MPGWLGVTLAVLLALVAGYRGTRRDAPGALMAVGMAVMSPGMAGIGPMVVRGRWWALGFVLVAIWPVLRPLLAKLPSLALDLPRAGPVCGGPVAHLLGGVAMVYMCAMPMAHHGVTTGTAFTASAQVHHLDATPVSDPAGMSGMSGMSGTGQMSDMAGASSSPLALVGWALAVYFLLGTVATLTRRNSAGALGRPCLPLLTEAIMGFGTVVMLITMT